MNRKKALGRGIAAMIPTGGSNDEDRKTLNEIPLTQIQVNPNQPRKEFDEEGMMELVSSISEHGIIQPVTVRQIDEDKYELIAGERRYRACRYLNFETIPAYVREISDDLEVMEMALIENIQRENLNPIEEAEAYSALIELHGMSQENVAQRVGKKRSTITNSLRLLRLPQEIRASLMASNDNFTAGHARAILALENEKRMINLWNRIRDERLSVRKAEELVSRLMQAKDSAPAETAEAVSTRGKKTKSPYLRSVEDKLQSVMGTKVQVKTRTREGGQIEIEFYSREDLERILEIFESIPGE